MLEGSTRRQELSQLKWHKNVKSDQNRRANDPSLQCRRIWPTKPSLFVQLRGHLNRERIRRNSRFRMTRRQRGCHSKESCFVEHHLSFSMSACNTRDRTSTRGRLQRSDVIFTAVQHPGIRLTFWRIEKCGRFQLLNFSCEFRIRSCSTGRCSNFRRGWRAFASY